MRRLSLSARVSLAASGAVLAVVAVHTALVQGRTAAEVAGWERERVAGVAHHVASMVENLPERSAVRVVAEASRQLEPFGIRLAFSPTEAPPGRSAVSVPVGRGARFVLAAPTDDLSTALRRRLARSSALLALGLLAGLLTAILASVRWGLVLPLRNLERRLRHMAAGPWRVTGPASGAAEVGRLVVRIDALGASLERSVSAWVHAERRAAAECARLELRRRLSPALREINLAASGLLAARVLDPEATRGVRRLLAAVDGVQATLREPVAPLPASHAASPGASG